MSKENRVSDERLTLIARGIAVRLEAGASGAPDLDRDIASAITELLSLRSKPVAGVEVKPLEWHGPDVNDEIYARSALCVYTIQKQRKSMGFWLTEVGGNYASIDEAKAAAEADYRQRILSTLSLPAQEPLAWRAFDPVDGEWALFKRDPRPQWECGPVVPLYASPQSEAVITEEMVERAYVGWLAGTHAEDWEVDEIKSLLRAALTATLKEA